MERALRTPTLPARATTASRTRAAAAYAGIAVLAAASAALAVAAQRDPDVLVPAGRVRYPGWLHGPLDGLGIDIGRGGVAWLLVAMCAGYAAVLVFADAVPARHAVAAIVGLHLLFVLAPPLLSSDVFGYVDLGRLGVLHGIDPFSPASTHTPPDAVHLYRRWGTDLPSPYGPLFVLIAYALVPLGISGGLWGFKLLTAAASLATIWLVWRCAERLGRDPRAAVVFVGLNPLVLLFAVGGAHNDFFATVAVTGAIYAVVRGRERLAGAALTAAAAIKIPLGVPLLFAAARPEARRRDLATGVALVLAATVVVALAVFGTDAVNFAGEVGNQQDRVAIYSIPNQLGTLLGFGGITAGIRLVAAAAVLATVAVTLRRTWRGGDWVAAAGWTTLALLVASAWLLPWYVTWLLPLAAISGDRHLRAGTLCLVAYVVATRVALWT